MNYIQHVLNDKNVQEQVISVNENVIGYMVQQFPIITKDIVCYVNKNRKKFVKNDLQSTKDTIKNFGEAVTVNYMYTCSMLLESELSDSEKIELINEIDIDNILAKTKSVAKDMGQGVADTFQNPLTSVAGKMHALTWIGGGIMTSSGPLSIEVIMQGGLIGKVWAALLPFGAVNFITVSTLVLASMILMFISARLMTRKDALLVYSLNSNLQKVMKLLKNKGFKDDFNKMEVKGNKLNLFQVKSFEDCQKSNKCELPTLANKEKKDCTLDCFFNFFITKELSKIIEVYIKYTKSIGVKTNGVTSMAQLFNRPIPKEGMAIQMAATEFNDSLYKMLRKLYKEDHKKQTMWINKINKIVENKSKSIG
jgi:hypothetical protein